MTQPLISVIVPVYNVEPYINKCIDSILSQTYKNLEVILVDDGSPDNCPKICDDYASIDNRVKVIHQKNAGLSVARNNALNICQGEYISFVDSDDWIEENLFEIAIGKMQENSVDIVSFSAHIVENDIVVGQEFVSFPQETLMSARAATEEILKDTISSQVWLRLYSRKCWSGIEFPKGRFYEDIATTYKCFELASNGVCFIPDTLYYYRHNSEGISLSFNPEKVYHIFLGFKEHYEYAKNNFKEAELCCFEKAVLFALNAYNNFLNNYNCDYDKSLKEIRSWISTNKSDIMRCKRITLHRKCSVLLLACSKHLYKTIYALHRKLKD